MSVSRNDPPHNDILARYDELRRRLEEAEDALRAIREGEVDAIIVSGSKGDRVFSLAETENLHRLMVEAMNEVGIATSPDGTILYCNRRASNLLKRAESELVGKPLRDFVAPQQQRRFDALIQEPNPLATERVMFIDSAGSALPLQVFASRVDTAGGSMVCLVATDLTRVEADQALVGQLREQQDALRARDAALTAATGRLAADLDFMSRLQRVAALFVRGDALQVILREMLDTAVVITGAMSADFQVLDPSTGAPYIVAHHGFEPWRLEFWQGVLAEHPGSCGAVWKSGQRVIIENVENDPLFAGTPALEMHRRAGVRAVQSTPLTGRSGAVIGVLSTHFSYAGRPDARTLGWLDLLARETADILGRVDTEAALRQAVVHSDQLVQALEEAQRELRTSHFHLEEMVKERTQLSEQRGEKLRVMANALSSAEQEERRRLAQLLHDDLQQMLVAIRLRLSNLESVVVGTSLVPTVSGINDIVGNAITASRSLTTELSPPILRESLPRMMEWLVRWLESRHGLFVDVSSEPDLNEPSEEARKFIFQAVRELLMNVRKHAGTDRARVRIFADAENLCLEVSDDGSGFDPAHTADGDHHAFGLFSIRERVEMLGGTLSIKSTPGKGSICVICVPVVPAYVEAARAAVTREAARAPDSATPGQVRILVVDDHTIFRRGLISILETYPDLKVVGEASDGEEGVKQATELMPDVVIMDLAMPRMNGIEATRIIKSRFMSIDVLALSFQESDHARSSVLDAGASAYFTKSGPLDALLRAIRAHGNGGGNGAATETPAPDAAVSSRPKSRRKA